MSQVFLLYLFGLIVFSAAQLVLLENFLFAEDDIGSFGKVRQELFGRGPFQQICRFIIKTLC